MPSTITDGTAANADLRARESRIRLALLRDTIEQLRPNRLMVPLFGALICAMFAQWVPFRVYALWYLVVLASMLPSLLLAIPQGELDPRQVEHWGQQAGSRNFVFLLGWSSLAWFFWVPGDDFNHILVQLILAATLSSHAGLIGASRDYSRPAFLLFGVVMTLAPLQSHGLPYLLLALVSPFYVGHVALIARRSRVRARATLALAEDKNALMAELVQAKQQSDLGRERAEAASVAKSQFLANMSHELRTPLNAIIGFSEMIASRIFAHEPERNIEYAGLIHSSGHHLLTLINDILDLAKIESGHWRLNETEIDLGRATDEALQLVAWKAKDNGAMLETDIAAGLPPLFADERAIKQILLNLLSNAVKFTPQGGTVTAFARVAEGEFRFGVSDTGIGIAGDDLSRVFDSFGQGQHDIAIADKGTGLGLAIVKGLAEAHGGSVSLQSERGRGTCVTVHLPLSRAVTRKAVA